MQRPWLLLCGALVVSPLAALGCGASTKARPPTPPTLRPSGDADGDGVPNSYDRCPTVAGVRPGGCAAAPPPAPKTATVAADIDRDGIVDTRDECPRTPGVEPNGCPVPDTDGDGIPDDEDQCVTDPEVYNGIADSDGCGDDLHFSHPNKPGPFEAKLRAERLTFARGSAELTAESRAALPRVAALITSAPDCQFTVTSGGGQVPEPEQFPLSRRRSAEFIHALLKLKVPVTQLIRKDQSEFPDRIPLGVDSVYIAPFEKDCVDEPAPATQTSVAR